MNLLGNVDPDIACHKFHEFCARHAFQALHACRRPARALATWLTTHRPPEARRRRFPGEHAVAEHGGGEGQGSSGVGLSPRARGQIRSGYNGHVPTVRLCLLVSATEVHRVCLLADFVEEGRTAIGHATSVSLHAPNRPAAADLIRQIGALGIPFEGHAEIDSRNYLIAGNGNQTSAVEAWAGTPAEMAPLEALSPLKNRLAKPVEH